MTQLVLIRRQLWRCQPAVFDWGEGDGRTILLAFTGGRGSDRYNLPGNYHLVVT